MSEAKPDAASATPVADPLHALVDWSVDLPLWQRDALRRLYQHGRITDADLSELLLMCKAQRGLATPTETAPTAVPLDHTHVPVAGPAGEPVALKRIGEVKHVNALAPNQSLSFREHGLTVVYGGNGSGKSGYVRVLKKLCRTRSEDAILHNVYQARPTDPASAQVRYTVADAGQPPFDWRDGAARPDALSRVSIFDAGCVPVYLEEATGLAYTPTALRILQLLADASQAIKQKLREEQEALLRAVPVGLRQPKVHAGTEVAASLGRLRGDTNVGEIEKLESLSNSEISRLAALRTDLASDPSRTARIMETRHSRLRSLIERTRTINSGLSNQSLENYRNAMRDAETKHEAARIAATELFSREPLPKVGSETWRALWEAARKYSTQDAYPGVSFPCGAAGARCVLCQQILQPDAATRMVNFERFVTENAQKAAGNARRAVGDLREELRTLTLTRQQIRDEAAFVRDELDQRDLASQMRGWLARAYVRCRQALRTAKNDEWPTVQDMPDPALRQMEEVLVGLEKRAAELRASAQATERQKLQSELDELSDRAWLGTVIDDVRQEIARRQKATAYELAMSDADTARTTRKSTEMAKSLITDALRDRFMEEIRRLGIDHLRIELRQEQGEYGVPKFRLVLVRTDTAKLTAVLSEGEHRCVALAAFLTELATADNHSGIVFDDPVCSLDHEYRERIAHRLAEEALTGRQVIVFTHDAAFLFMLDDAAQKFATPIEYRSINRSPGGCSPLLRHR